ncbi:MAG TPA: hypothetical protein VJB98_03100 [Candidatus Paceibacterota bacterium]
MNRRVLLVEDDPLYIEVIGTFVRLFLQHDLQVATSPVLALAALVVPRSDLILLDLGESPEDAFDFSNFVRAQATTHDLPILALCRDEEERLRSLGESCSAGLVKPFRVRELEAFIRRLLPQPVGAAA